MLMSLASILSFFTFVSEGSLKSIIRVGTRKELLPFPKTLGLPEKTWQGLSNFGDEETKILIHFHQDNIPRY